MAIKKQNLALVSTFVFTTIILGLILFQSRQYFLDNTLVEKAIPQIIKEVSQEQMGVVETQIPFLEILKNMTECLKIQASISNGMTANIESILLVLQPALGPQKLKDKSLLWHLRGRDGLEKKLTLVLTANEEGKQIKQMEYFSVDAKGTEVKLDLDPEKSNNPSDEYLNTFLKDVEVLQKVKTSVAEFTNGSILNFQEENGAILNFEINKDQNTFHCQSLKAADNCQCLQ